MPCGSCFAFFTSARDQGRAASLKLKLPIVQSEDRFVQPDEVLDEAGWKSPRTVLKEDFFRLLTAGGDERLVIEPTTGLNKYHISLEPVPDGIFRSSSTANTMTPDLLDFGMGVVSDLQKQVHMGAAEEDLFRHAMDKLRASLRKMWNIEGEFSATMTPSGTDAELVPLMLAVLRAQRAREEEEDRTGVLTVLAAAGEVGSNTFQAATGQLCGKVLPFDTVQRLVTERPKVQRKPSDDTLVTSPKMRHTDSFQQILTDKIFPTFGSISCIPLPLRDDITGELTPIAEMDAKMKQVVSTAVNSGAYASIIVHMVLGCKTGHCVPSVGCLLELVAEYPNTVIPVVDACQMRGLTSFSLRRLLEHNFIVICTGSKFYGGPPFAGAVLWPRLYSQEVDDHLRHSLSCKSLIRNSLLSKYLDASMVSYHMGELRAILPQMPNWGLLLRWTLAERNIAKYHDIPDSIREDIIRKWVIGLQELIARFPSCIELLERSITEVELTEAVEEDNKIFGIGLPRTGTHSLAEALKCIGCCGLNKCTLTKSTVLHMVPKNETVTGRFDIDNSNFRAYQEVFEQHPNAKFIVTTRDSQAYRESVERWDEKNKDRDDLNDMPRDADGYLDEVTRFFVHRRAAHQLLVIDLFKMQDDELWQKLMGFVLRDSANMQPFDPTKIPFPRAVVQVSGQLTQNSDVKKAGGTHTSANDLELLSGQVRSIIPISLKKKSVAKKRGEQSQRYDPLTLNELKRLHLLLALDCTLFSPPLSGLSDDQKSVLARRCFVAQPLSITTSAWSGTAYKGCLRIALGAASIIDAAAKQNSVQDLLSQDDAILRKLALLLEHWHSTTSWPVTSHIPEVG